MSVLIKGGRVITAADDYVADIVIEGERISLIGESLDVTTDKVIDASGKYVLPGAVDPHTHLEMPWRGKTTVDDFYHGHVAAAFGGTTTHVDFCIQAKGQTFGEALDAWHAKREGKALIDNGFHIIVTDLSENGGTLEELGTLPEEHGVSSYKLFMAYNDSLRVSDEDLFRVMQVAAKTGACVMVHAENGDVIEVLMADAIAAGNTAPVYHALTRPPETEGEATNRAVQLAHVAGAPLYVVHVSCEESLEPIVIAREKGWNVWGETCTQYFFVDTSFLERMENFEAANYVYTPPPRPKKNQEILWNAVRTNALQAISTDHCAYTLEQKALGKDDFRQIPNGAVRDGEPPADDPPLRRPRRADHPESHGRAPRHESGEVVRDVPEEGDDRGRQRRRHRGLRPREACHHLRQDSPLGLGHQHLRGDRGARLAGGRPPARQRDRRG